MGEAGLRLEIRVRRFRCTSSACKRKTFAQGFQQLTTRYARRTKRLETLIWHIGQVAGGQGGSRLTNHLKIPTTRHSILRILRSNVRPKVSAVRVLGVDDWAKKRGQTYGTILVDLEAHCVVDLLPDRQSDTLADWLKRHPSIEMVARDRSTEYANGIERGAPNAIQIADRWHLLKNLTEMAERALREQWSKMRSHPAVHSSDSQVVRPPLPRSKDELEQQRLSRERRIRDFQRVQYLKQQNYSQRRIARVLGLNRATVKLFWEAELFPERQKTPLPSMLDPFIEYMTARLQSGPITMTQLWHEVVARGYPGQLSQVRKWVTLYRQQVLHPTQTPPLPIWLPSRDSCLQLLIAPPERLNKAEADLLSQLLQVDTLSTLHHLIHHFTTMVRQRQNAGFDTWLDTCMTCGIQACKRFAESLKQDYHAVKAALALEWSNGQTEGHVHRLKLLKRQMYGRANLDLLCIRVCYKPT